MITTCNVSTSSSLTLISRQRFRPIFHCLLWITHGACVVDPLNVSADDMAFYLFPNVRHQPDDRACLRRVFSSNYDRFGACTAEGLYRRRGFCHWTRDRGRTSGYYPQEFSLSSRDWSGFEAYAISSLAILVRLCCSPLSLAIISWDVHAEALFMFDWLGICWSYFQQVSSVICF